MTTATEITPQTSQAAKPPPDAQAARAACEPTTPDGQPGRVPQTTNAVRGPTSEGGHPTVDPQRKNAALGPILADPLLGMSADVLNDLEIVRCANESRLRTLTAEGEHGHGLTLHNPDVMRLAVLVEDLKAAEHQAILNLKRNMRAHALGPWVKNNVGVGEKQAARLLATIRDPYWNDLHNRPRTVSELWAYCGLHVAHPGSHNGPDTHGANAAGVAPKRTRGQKSNWSEEARQRVWLISTSCIKQADSPYRMVYDAAREQYADAVHPTDCNRCGPKGKPALAGSPLSLGHQNARAIRRMSKELLKDLWREAKRLHLGDVER